jgi:hypothetical protein
MLATLVAVGVPPAPEPIRQPGLGARLVSIVIKRSSRPPLSSTIRMVWLPIFSNFHHSFHYFHIFSALMSSGLLALMKFSSHPSVYY